MTEFLSDNENSLNVCDETFFDCDDGYPVPRDIVKINEEEIPEISVEGTLGQCRWFYFLSFGFYIDDLYGIGHTCKMCIVHKSDPHNNQLIYDFFLRGFPFCHLISEIYLLSHGITITCVIQPIDATKKILNSGFLTYASPSILLLEWEILNLKNRSRFLWPSMSVIFDTKGGTRFDNIIYDGGQISTDNSPRFTPCSTPFW